VVLYTVIKSTRGNARGTAEEYVMRAVEKLGTVVVSVLITLIPVATFLTHAA